MIVFMDVTAARRLQDELEHTNRQLEAAYEELQSTNEELDTAYEELQSTNEELETMNEELRDRTGELDRLNAILEAVFTSLHAGVVVVDRDFEVRVWNRRCEDLWGIRSEEAVGQHFLNLDLGLPTDELRPMIRQLLNVDVDVERREAHLVAMNRRGRQIGVRVVGTPLRRDGDGATDVILMMDLDRAAAPV